MKLRYLKNNLNTIQNQTLKHNSTHECIFYICSLLDVSKRNTYSEIMKYTTDYCKNSPQTNDLGPTIQNMLIILLTKPEDS